MLTATKRENIELISDVFGLIITVYGTTVSDASAGQLNNGYYVDEQALESLMKKILQQQENMRRDAKVAKLESILDIEVRNSCGKRAGVYFSRWQATFSSQFDN